MRIIEAAPHKARLKDEAMKKIFMERSAQMLSDIYDSMENLPDLKIKQLESEKTAVVFVDIINGFISEGTLHDKRIGRIIPEAVKLLKYANLAGMKSLAFADCHRESAAEFSAFPPHCISGSHESEIADELKNIGGYLLIEKNSTNGFHAPGFQQFIKSCGKENFIVCGDCTDICVMNFCLTLKTYFDQNDKKCKIAVPVNITETFDGNGHYSEFMNKSALCFMRNAGIELFGGIDYE